MLLVVLHLSFFFPPKSWADFEVISVVLLYVCLKKGRGGSAIFERA